MRQVQGTLAIVGLLCAFTATALLAAVTWESTSTSATSSYVNVFSDVSEAVPSISNRACAEDEEGFGEGCTSFITCGWTDFCYTFQYWPENCTGTGKGVHVANPEGQAQMQAFSTDSCE